MRHLNERHETARRTLPLVVLALCFVMSLSACGNTKSERALSGAGIGAGVGAVGSVVTGGSPVTGAVVGGVLGGATGALTKKSQIDLGK
jgi:hypothetical protein